MSSTDELDSAGSHGDRLHQRQRVAHAMLKFGKQHAQAALALAQGGFRLHRAGDVKEGQDRAGDEIVDAAIGVDARNVMVVLA
jgi:hypothetical protein